MAGDWIKWVKGLHERREVAVMAELLELDPRMVAGCCMQLWEWADENVDRAGRARGLSLTFINKLVGIQKFAENMKFVGWIEPVEEGGFRFCNWNRHNSKSAKQRALANKRKRKQRDTEMSRAERDKNGTREEKRREEILELPNGNSGRERSESQKARDMLWEPLAAKFFPSGVSKRDAKRLGGIVTCLLAKNATPQQIGERIAAYPKVMPGGPTCLLTIESLEKHWDSLNGRGGPSSPKPRRNEGIANEAEDHAYQAAMKKWREAGGVG